MRFPVVVSQTVITWYPPLVRKLPSCRYRPTGSDDEVASQLGPQAASGRAISPTRSHPRQERLCGCSWDSRPFDPDSPGTALSGPHAPLEPAIKRG